MSGDFYEVLGVDEDASPDEVRRAYRDRAGEYHPDVNDHPRARDQFARLTTARDVLADPDERELYDELGHDAYVDEHLDGLATPPMAPEADDGEDVAESAVREAARDATEAPVGFGSRAAPGALGPDGQAPGRSTADAKRAGSPEPSTPAEGSPHSDGGVSWEKSRRRQAARKDRTRSHLTASFRWVPTVLAAVLYGLGLGRYLRVNRDGYSAAIGALAADPITGLNVLHGRSGVSSPLSYAQSTGLGPGSKISYGTALVAGGVALGVIVLWSVWEVRRTTNWSPSWWHTALALGPTTSLALHFMVSGPEPAAPIPLWLDSLLLVVFPGAGVLSYLVNRFLLVVPLVRTTDR